MIKRPLKPRLSAIAVTGFLIFWVTGMATALSAGACRNPRFEARTRLGYCTTTLVPGSWMDLSELEAARRSRLRVERGIALAELGREAEATAGFARAARDAAAVGGPWPGRLSARIEAQASPEITALWAAAEASAR